MLKIVKFGGSSMADAGQYAKVKSIIEADRNRRVVVVSAAGKRFSGDHKVTDLLYLCHAHIKYGVDSTGIFDMISERYCSIRDDLGLKTDIEKELNAIKEKLTTGISSDELVSRGEYLSAILMADYLGFKFVDAADWITFGYDGEIDYELSYSKLRKLESLGEGIVIPGFYGVLPNGEIKVMSRGGSDITGALAAAALNADVYENWTDVPGVLMADPRIVDDPKPIKRITYDELRELSYMGAQVLHEQTVYPVKELNIPLNIRDTNRPELPGTMILGEFEDTSDDNDFITGMAGRKDFLIVNFTKSGLSSSIGVIGKVCAIFEKYNIPIEYIPSGIDSLSFVVSSHLAKKRIYSIVSEIEKTVKPDTMDICESIAVIAIVGRKMSFRPGTSGRLFGVLGENDINIRMISQGTDERNIVFGVNNEDYEKTIRVLYDSFIR